LSVVIRIGTLCYVDSSCEASPATQKAVGRIVEVVSAPYMAPSDSYLPGTYYDVAFEGWTYFCRSDKLHPINDPGADVGEWVEDELKA
jgi:hypothetical protein